MDPKKAGKYGESCRDIANGFENWHKNQLYAHSISFLVTLNKETGFFKRFSKSFIALETLALSDYNFFMISAIKNVMLINNSECKENSSEWIGTIITMSLIEIITYSANILTMALLLVKSRYFNISKNNEQMFEGAHMSYMANTIIE